MDADMKSHFDTIPKDRLMGLVKEKVSDGTVLGLVEQFLNQKVVGGPEGRVPEAGTPQGAVIGPMPSNIYLDPSDWEMEMAGVEMVRYADDFALLCRTEEEAQTALARAVEWTEKAGLTPHSEKTRIVGAEHGSLVFLNHRFDRGKRFPGPNAAKKLKDNVRTHTKRISGHSVDAVITRLNWRAG